MTNSIDLVADVRLSKEKIKIGNTHLINVDCVGIVSVAFPNESGDLTLRIENVAYVP